MSSTAAVIHQSEPVRQTCTVIAAVLSFVGAGIAGTLWWTEKTRQDVPCSADGGCAIVAASKWSHVDLIFWHDVPVALLGLLGYIFLLSIAMLRLGWENEAVQRRLHGLTWLTTATGTAYSWYLQWIAHFEIGAYCPWCRASAITMTVLFLTVTAEWLAQKRRRNGRVPAHE